MRFFELLLLGVQEPRVLLRLFTEKHQWTRPSFLVYLGTIFVLRRRTREHSVDRVGFTLLTFVLGYTAITGDSRVGFCAAKVWRRVRSERLGFKWWQDFFYFVSLLSRIFEITCFGFLYALQSHASRSGAFCKRLRFYWSDADNGRESKHRCEKATASITPGYVWRLLA